MDRINLLPDDLALTWTNRILYLMDRKFVPTLIRSVAVLSVALITMTLTLAFLAAGLRAQTTRLEARQASLREELQALGTLADQLRQREQQLIQQLGRHEERLKYLGSFQDQRGHWAKLFQEIKRALPRGVWLTELEGSPKGQLRMVGGALEEDSITQFMGELKTAPSFSDVDFNFTKKDKIGDTAIVRFEVICQIVASAGGGG